MDQESEALTRVRRLAPPDLARVLAWRNDPAINRHMFTQHHITLEEHQRWFERATLDPRKHLFVFESSGEPLGYVNFNEMSSGGIVDWGFYTAPDAPKGTGRSLGRTALAHAFGELGLHKVCGEVLVGNVASTRMHEALGFQKEGLRRDQHFDGAMYHDVISFGLLASEWQSTTNK